MHLETTEELFHALRASGLFTEEQLDAMARDWSALGASSVMKRLIRGGRLTVYQLRKLAHGKVADLLVGPYLVTDKIGEGGMGKVFRAHRRDGGGLPVALKVVRPALVASPTVRGRFAREVQAAGVLSHPNIVRLFDAGEADGKFYLAMEFVDGVELARLVQSYGPLEVAEACEYSRQAALGLSHAHDRGFVHRDVKPSNVMLAGQRHLPQATGLAVVKLLDLGLIRAMQPDDMVVPNLTRDHTLVGTPDFVAPEQAKNSKLADPRADLYSLGCTLYFLLTGRVPFAHKAAIDKIVAHQGEPPPPLQALRPEVPTRVAQLVARLMAKNPEDRVQSAAEVAAALEEHAKYPPGAAPVAVHLRDSAQDTEHSGNTTPGQGETAPPGGAPAPRSALGLARDEPRAARPQPPPSPGDATQALNFAPASEPVADHALAPQSAARKPKPRALSKRTRRDVPQLVWAGVALAGVAILVLMLWLMQGQ